MTVKPIASACASVALVVSSASGALAQVEPDPTLPAINPAIAMSADFPQQVVTVTGGGPITVAPDPRQGCPVRATEAATVTVEVGADVPTGFDLYASSEGQAALLVITPEGDWLCSSASGERPAVRRIADPVEGAYQVWVSESDSSDAVEMTLTLTEVDVVGQGLNAVPRFNLDVASAFGTFAVHNESVRTSTGTACEGLVRTERPSFELELTAGDSATLPPLIFTTLAENTYGMVFEDPSGAIMCQVGPSDRVEGNPTVGAFRSLINRPAGVYRVWVPTRFKTPAQLSVMPMGNN